MTKTGRPTLIRGDIAKLVDKMLESAYTYADIERHLKEEYNLNISDTTISRYAENVGKEYSRDRPLNILSDYDRLWLDVDAHIGLVTNLSKSDKTEMRRYFHRLQKLFRMKLEKVGDLNPDDDKAYKQFVQLVCELSCDLCNDCRNYVMARKAHELRGEPVPDRLIRGKTK